MVKPYEEYWMDTSKKSMFYVGAGFVPPCQCANEVCWELVGALSVLRPVGVVAQDWRG